MPEPSGSLTAVIVSGGKQYRVAPGDRILVDRLGAEPGTELTLGRVLLVSDGETTRVGLHELMGQAVRARVLAHPRGPKIDVLRYKSKKRVRVHRGARAEHTALEILAIGQASDFEKTEPKAGSSRSRSRTRARSGTAKTAEAGAEDSD